MGHVVGRVVVAAALLLATSYLLQADDSFAAAARPAQAAAAPRVPAVQVDPILTVRAGSGDREYFVSRHEIVALGADSLRLPILMYHYIRKPPSIRVDPAGFKLSVAAADFEAQMDWLHGHGFHPVNFNQVRAYFAGADPLPSRPVVMTFDDGYQDLYSTAFPILKSHGFTAVAYIVSGFVDWPNYVTRGQVLEMDHAGIEIASHTVHHPNLAHTGFGTVMNEVAQSKQWLEQLLGHPVLDFAYPSGQFTTQTVQAVRQAGYSTAVTTDRDSTAHSLADRYVWGRVRVGGGESLEDFVVKLGPTMPSVMVSSVEVESITSPPQSG